MPNFSSMSLKSLRSLSTITTQAAAATSSSTQPSSQSIIQSNYTASSSFRPRTTFAVSQNIKRAYYLGHHRTTLQKLSALRSSTDFYIDVRDYRLPFTSANPLLERALAGLPRIIVYTKKDLGVSDGRTRSFKSRGGGYRGGNSREKYLTNHDPKQTEDILTSLHEKTYGHATKTFFLSATRPHKESARDLHEAIKQMTLRTAPHRDLSVRPATGLLVGMPNVGKSTLLNALRATAGKPSSSHDFAAQESMTKKNKILGKVAKTGDTPGITRSVSERTHITAYSPNQENEADDGDGTATDIGPARIYARDTPGVFIPYVSSPLSMLKLSLTACISSSVVPLLVVVDYLLFQMNLISPELYMSHVMASGKTMALCANPTNDVSEFLQHAAIRLGKLKRHGVPDEEGAAEWILRRYREGYLGRFVLDDVQDQGAVAEYLGREERASIWWADTEGGRK